MSKTPTYGKLLPKNDLPILSMYIDFTYKWYAKHSVHNNFEDKFSSQACIN